MVERIGEVRRRVRVIGPSRAGFSKAEILRASDRRDPALLMSTRRSFHPSFRAPNSSFVGATRRGELRRIEAHGELWLEIQDLIRPVLNRSWDPIGVSGVVDSEYEHYIGPLYELLTSGAADKELIEHLRAIETQSIGLRPSSDDTMSRVIAELRVLCLPTLPL